jgi:hypothetical protein
MNVSELKIGQFAEVNRSIVYRYILINNTTMFPSLDGLLIIERHPEKTLSWLDLQKGELIINPKEKHINNTKVQLKDMNKFKFLDNLTYIENLNILQNYLKSDIVETEEK